MSRTPEQRVRDRAMWFARLASGAGVAAALGLSGAFAVAAASYFPGRAAPPSPPAPPVPDLPAPVQKVAPAPTVIVQVVHHPAGSGGYASGPSAPYYAPAPISGSSGGGSAPPPPPPPPPCHSTPSHPC